MHDGWFSKLKRKTAVTGHYGSGKTEFSVSLAMILAEMRGSGSPDAKQSSNSPVSLIDLDIINPYFRSRERREQLEKAGISVYSCVFEKEITAELPALGAVIRTPLENKSTCVIIDLGGNGSGALIINQFRKYFTGTDTAAIAVVNANRPGTATALDALGHIAAIESAAGLSVRYIVNNTHLLRETTVHDIEKGHKLCLEICAGSDKELLCDCYPGELIDIKMLAGLSENLLPLGLHMRPRWLDR